MEAKAFHIYLIFICLFLLLSALSWGRYLLAYLRYKKRPWVVGALTYSSVVPARFDPHNDEMGYAAKIRYCYSVDGQLFEGANICSLSLFSKQDMGTVSSRKQAVEKWMAHLKSSNGFRVYYNPENPAESFLLNGPKVIVFLPAFVITIFIFITAALIVQQCSHS